MKIGSVHKDWYEDGIEDGENCFRLDFDYDGYDGVLQAQLFLKVKADADKSENVEYGKCRLFIERDQREDGNTDVRIDYAGDVRKLTQQEAAELLAGDTAAFVAGEKVLIERVLALPRDADYCDK